MREARGDLWSFWNAGHWVCILTNGQISSRGHLIMGAGVARQARDRFHDLAPRAGGLVQKHGNHVWAFPTYRLFTFPTKHHWQDPSDPDLIVASARELMEKIDETWKKDSIEVYLPRPGCGLGGLEWDVVRPLIAPILDDRVVVITF